MRFQTVIAILGTVVALAMATPVAEIESLAVLQARGTNIKQYNLRPDEDARLRQHLRVPLHFGPYLRYCILL